MLSLDGSFSKEEILRADRKGGGDESLILRWGLLRGIVTVYEHEGMLRSVVLEWKHNCVRLTLYVDDCMRRLRRG